MSDQCVHCNVRGDWAQCQSLKCYAHDGWAWQQLQAERDQLREDLSTCYEELQGERDRADKAALENQRLRGLLGEMDKYLDTNSLTNIMSGSIFHRDIKGALK